MAVVVLKEKPRVDNLKLLSLLCDIIVLKIILIVIYF